MAFARDQESWIRAALAALPQLMPVRLNTQVPVEGRMLTLLSTTGRAVRIETDAMLVPGDPDHAGIRAAAFLKHRARDRLTAASDRYARQIGRSYASMTLRDTRSRWGSCTVDGRLMFSWRLAMAPPEVLDYVAAHEVAHLAQMNHSPAFWEVVNRMVPAYRVHRGWLKANGKTLHAYRFAADEG